MAETSTNPVAISNSAPSIFGTPPTVIMVNTSYAFTPAATDPDFDVLTFSIVNKPSWANFDTTTGTLSGTPGSGAIGTTTGIVISVNDGSLSAALPGFDLAVSPRDPKIPASNTNPVEYLWSTLEDGARVYVDREFVFGDIPVSYEGLNYLMTANDDSYLNSPDAISFDVTDPITVYVGYDAQITPLPAWLSTWTSTGDHWNGPEVQTDVYRKDFPAGTIILGGNTMGFKMYSVAIGPQDTVAPPPPSPPSGGTNTAPTISGLPDTSVVAGSEYRFAPMAADADGDPLAFTINNKPGWAGFNAETGRLSGTPVASDVGAYDNIVIAVHDGTDGAALRPFSIIVTGIALGSATLTWIAPTQNADGTPLTDLAGFRAYYSKILGSYSSSVKIDNPGVTTYVIDNLSEGTWYFAVTAFDESGNESNLSEAASMTILLP